MFNPLPLASCSILKTCWLLIQVHLSVRDLLRGAKKALWRVKLDLEKGWDCRPWESVEGSRQRGNCVQEEGDPEKEECGFQCPPVVGMLGITLFNMVEGGLVVDSTSFNKQ